MIAVDPSEICFAIGVKKISEVDVHMVTIIHRGCYKSAAEHDIVRICTKKRLFKDYHNPV
jgi:hypothetical protein